MQEKEKMRIENTATMAIRANRTTEKRPLPQKAKGGDLRSEKPGKGK